MVNPLTNPFLGGPPPLGSLFTAAGQRLSAELDGALRDAGFPDLRSAHAPIFMGIAPEGSRVSDLASRARMTKQAAGELIRYLAERDYLAVSPDPSDGRAKRVELTDRGWEAIMVGERVIAGFDAWLAEQIGADEVDRLRQILITIAETGPSGR
ncbi:MAG TPA: MarR family transcriptional regulator [Friedmanniella sp.]